MLFTANKHRTGCYGGDAALHVRTGEDGQMSSELLGRWADEYGLSEEFTTAGEDGTRGERGDR